MSAFEIEEKTSQTSSHICVKRLDKEWQNFPKTILPTNYAERLESYKKFHVRSDDIFILGFQRSGTTMLQELGWIIANDFDFDTLLEYDCEARVVFFEVPEFSLKFREKTLANSLEEMKSPRLIKSHLPVQLLPDEIWTKKPKLLFINRDPKDVAISHYHLLSAFSLTSFKLEDHLEDFLADAVMYSPYREYIQNYLNLPDYKNILFLTYEDMLANLDETIQKVAKFLGKTVTEENTEKIKNYLRFENMKNRKTNDNKFAHKMWMQSIDPNSSNDINFIRKGVVGGYKDELPKGYADRIDNWYEDSQNLNQGYNYKE